MTYKTQLDQKAADLLAGGFDPGPAASGVVALGAGGYRTHGHAVLTAHPSAGAHEVHGLTSTRTAQRGGLATSREGRSAGPRSTASWKWLRRWLALLCLLLGTGPTRVFADRRAPSVRARVAF
jgi:hypothetical protein